MEFHGTSLELQRQRFHTAPDFSSHLRKVGRRRDTAGLLWAESSDSCQVGMWGSGGNSRDPIGCIAGLGLHVPHSAGRMSLSFDKTTIDQTSELYYFYHQHCLDRHPARMTHRLCISARPVCITTCPPTNCTNAEHAQRSHRYESTCMRQALSSPGSTSWRWGITRQLWGRVQPLWNILTWN